MGVKKKKETGTSELCWSPPAAEAFRGPGGEVLPSSVN